MVTKVVSAESSSTTTIDGIYALARGGADRRRVKRRRLSNGLDVRDADVTARDADVTVHDASVNETRPTVAARRADRRRIARQPAVAATARRVTRAAQRANGATELVGLVC